MTTCTAVITAANPANTALKTPITYGVIAFYALLSQTLLTKNTNERTCHSVTLMNNPFQPTSNKQRAKTMYRSCYSDPYEQPTTKPKQTRLEAIWNAVDQTSDDNTAIAMVESVRHLGFGKDEDQS